MKNIDDQTLIDRCLQGEVDCFEELLKRYETMVRTMVARLIKDEDSVDDVAQQVFIQAYEKLDQFKGRSKFSTWLGQIALNKGRDFLRAAKAQRQRQSVDCEDIPLRSEAASPLQAASACQECNFLRIAMSSLRQQDRELILLRYVQDNDFATIAGVLNSTPDAAKVRSFRARAKLRDELGRMGVEF